MELGKKIRALRFKADMTQEQLADKLGIAAQSVSKWENGTTMPDIITLPLLAEIFGVTIDDLFDLTVEQRFNRIENRMDVEDDLPQDIFLEYEEFLKSQLTDETYRKRATELIAYLYWHRMEMFSKKASRYARDAVRLTPGEKGCQWILQKAEGHAAWDWNISNHTAAIEFYKDLVEKNPAERMPYYYLLDNLIADHRADEADRYLERLSSLPDTRPIRNQEYRAHIALARFDEKTADRIIEQMLSDNPEDWICLFEAAQYYAKKCNYARAIELYEQSFEKTTRRPRFTDELMGIRDIYVILGEYGKAADTCGRIIDLLENEWCIRESDELKALKEKKAELLKKA
ncbi:MAG: helix-turn-helix domain-containing protein [Clostridiales bacterium]|nr:helix-turn-helix domain-containing protein [Clostridiales bacterium]